MSVVYAVDLASVTTLEVPRPSVIVTFMPAIDPTGACPLAAQLPTISPRSTGVGAAHWDRPAVGHERHDPWCVRRAGPPTRNRRPLASAWSTAVGLPCRRRVSKIGANQVVERA